MTEDADELVTRLHREEIERIRNEPAPTERPAPSHPELPDVRAGSPVAEEWAIYRGEVGRLIREGSQGKFALIKVGQPISLWDTLHDAVQAGQVLHGQAPCLVQQVWPYLRPRIGYRRL